MASSKVIPVLIVGPFPEDLYQVLASIFLKEVHVRTWPFRSKETTNEYSYSTL